MPSLLGQRIADLTGRPSAQVSEDLHAKSEFELDLLLDAACLEHAFGSMGWLCREAVWAARSRSSLGAWIASQLEQRGSTVDDLIAVGRGLIAAIEPTAMPALLAWDRGRNQDDWLTRTAGIFTELATAIPSLPLALAVEPIQLDAFLRTEQESRAKAMVREGVVKIEGHAGCRWLLVSQCWLRGRHFSQNLIGAGIATAAQEHEPATVPWLEKLPQRLPWHLGNSA